MGNDRWSQTSSPRGTAAIRTATSTDSGARRTLAFGQKWSPATAVRLTPAPTAEPSAAYTDC
jgi:hypothetical protein